jgi:hypothetical protein
LRQFRRRYLLFSRELGASSAILHADMHAQGWVWQLLTGDFVFALFFGSAIDPALSISESFSRPIKRKRHGR